MLHIFQQIVPRRYEIKLKCVYVIHYVNQRIVTMNKERLHKTKNRFLLMAPRNWMLAEDKWLNQLNQKAIKQTTASLKVWAYHPPQLEKLPQASLTHQLIIKKKTTHTITCGENVDEYCAGTNYVTTVPKVGSWHNQDIKMFSDIEKHWQSTALFTLAKNQPAVIPINLDLRHVSCLSARPMEAAAKDDDWLKVVDTMPNANAYCWTWKMIIDFSNSQKSVKNWF